MRSLARASSRSSVSRATMRRCSAAAALASASRKAGKSGGDVGLAGRRLRLFAGARGDDANGFVLGALGFADFAARRDPAQMKQQRFGAAHLAGNVAVAHRLPRLGLQRRDLGGKLADDVFDPRQILLGGLEPQFRFVAARMQAGNAGRFFQHAPALVRPRLDDLADAALVHQGG